MKKNYTALGLLVILVVLGGIFLLRKGSEPDGMTVESREEILNKAITTGKGWTIATETPIENCIVSGCTSSDGKAALAVFENRSSGVYALTETAIGNNDEILLVPTFIGGKFIDISWFNGAETEYAEYIYTVDGVAQSPIKLMTHGNDIVAFQNDEKTYDITIAYYDKDGNKYE